VGVYVFGNRDAAATGKNLQSPLITILRTTSTIPFSFLGTNPTNSIDSYFLSFANQNGGIALSNLKLLSGETIDDLYQYLGETNGLGFEAQQAFLGYQGYVINPVNDTDNNTHIPPMSQAGNFLS